MFLIDTDSDRNAKPADGCELALKSCLNGRTPCRALCILNSTCPILGGKLPAEPLKPKLYNSDKATEVEGPPKDSYAKLVDGLFAIHPPKPGVLQIPWTFKRLNVTARSRSKKWSFAGLCPWCSMIPIGHLRSVPAG